MSDVVRQLDAMEIKMTNNVASYANIFNDFAMKLTRDMKPHIKKHFSQYVLGMMIPPEKRRKSIVAINDLVSESDQSTMNRTLHGTDPSLLEGNWISLLKEEIGDHPVILVVDDALANHPGGNAMEAVGYFFDRKTGRSVMAHQFVTSGLYDTITNSFYPFLMRLYQKKEYCRKHNETFRTKIEIAEIIGNEAFPNFNVESTAMDSWYASHDFMDFLGPFITELKSNRSMMISEHGERKTDKNAFKWIPLNILAECLKPRLMERSDLDLLPQYNRYFMLEASLSDGAEINLLVLYDEKHDAFKFLASNDALKLEDFLKLWRIRWMIEEFHKEGKNLGMGAYQVRDETTPLIHGVSLIAAYTLLSIMIRISKKLFGKAAKTIGECSRLLKEKICFKKNYKSKLFTG